MSSDDPDLDIGTLRSVVNAVEHSPAVAGANLSDSDIIVANRWLNTDLVTELKKTTKVTFADDMGVVDFYPAPDRAVVYLTVDDLLASIGEAKRRLVKLRNIKHTAGFVIAECHKSNRKQFEAIQNFAVIDLRLVVVLPVVDHREAAVFLSQMVFVHNRATPNPFKVRKVVKFTAHDEAEAIQCIPGIGEIRAKRLVQRFGSLKKICDASVEELSTLVSHTQAVEIHKFFHDTSKRSE